MKTLTLWHTQRRDAVMLLSTHLSHWKRKSRCWSGCSAFPWVGTCARLARLGPTGVSNRLVNG